MSTAMSFQKLLNRVEPSASEQAAARQHANTIWTRLKSSFNLKRPLITGSFARGSSISKSSDIDLFAVFSRDDARWGESYKTSTAMLGNIKEDLRARYRSTDISIDGQAVVVNFSSSNIIVDVVPAIFWGVTEKKQPLYLMPDGNGWWMQTSPDAYNGYLKKANENSGWKLRRTAQLLKYWRECRNVPVPISSFHIEMLLAAEGVCAGPKSYAECLTNALGLLAERECRDFRDPLGIGKMIRATKSASQREYALNSIIYSAKHARMAFDLETSRQSALAKDHWNTVFNGQFPR